MGTKTNWDEVVFKLVLWINPGRQLSNTQQFLTCPTTPVGQTKRKGTVRSRTFVDWDKNCSISEEVEEEIKKTK